MRYALGLLIFLIWCSCQEDSHIILYNQTGQNTLIVVSPSASTSNAAQELALLLGKSIKGEVVIQSSITENHPAIILEIHSLEYSFDPLKPGNTRYFAKEGNVHISGSDSLHLYYAVYDFLEKEIGYRWLDPETDFIPLLKEIKVNRNLEYSYTPDVATRTVHARSFYENPKFALKHKVTNSAFPYYTPKARVHTFHRFLPRDQYMDKHPEYFALRKGRRISTQLCLTNSQVLQIIIDSVQAHFKRNPEALVVSVSQDDNSQYCMCESCKYSDQQYGGPGGTMIHFVNQVATEFPDKIISTLAYQYTRKPGSVKPAKNVLVTLCSIECDRSGPITQNCTQFADDMNDWNKLDATLRIWDYTTQFTNFLAPFPNLRTLQPNIQFFRNNQTKWIFEQHSHHPSDLFDFRVYLTAKLLWNPDLDVDSLMTDFSKHYYESAHEFIMAYINSVHDALDEDEDFFLYLYGDPSQAFNSFLHPNRLTEYMKYFTQAESASDNEQVKKRVHMARIGLDYAVLEAYRKNISSSFSLVSSETGKTNPDFQVTLDRFEATCADNNITLMNEMRYSVAEYLAGWNRTIVRANKPNIAINRVVTLHTKPKKYAGEDPQVLTDGAQGGASFFANWLGFEGNHMVAELDLQSPQKVTHCGMAFLQVVNHLVFFPQQVTYYYAGEDRKFRKLGSVINTKPLSPSSKINDIQDFDLSFDPVTARYLKVEATNLLTPPDWHHGAGLPAWIFADEWIVY